MIKNSYSTSIKLNNQINIYYTILHKTSTFTTWSTKQKNSWFFFSQKHRDILQEKTLLPLSQTKTNLFVNSLDEKLLISIFFIDTCDMIENHPKTMVGIWIIWYLIKKHSKHLFKLCLSKKISFLFECKKTRGSYKPVVSLTWKRFCLNFCPMNHTFHPKTFIPQWCFLPTRVPFRWFSGLF